MARPPNPATWILALALAAGCAPGPRIELEVDLAAPDAAARFATPLTLAEARRSVLRARAVRFSGLPAEEGTLRVGVAAVDASPGAAAPASRAVTLRLSGPRGTASEQRIDLAAADGFVDHFLAKPAGVGYSLSIAGAGALLALDRPSFSPRRARRRPDLLLVSVDTLRADALQWMPRLTELAGAGRSFPRAWSTSNWTLPAHASLFLSRAVHELALPRPGDADPHPRAHLPAELPTLAEVLAAAGYATFASTEGGYVHPAYGFARGFESYVTLPSRAQQGADPLAEHLRRFGRFLASGQGPRPYFAFVHTYEVHDFFLNDAAYHARLEPGDAPWAARGNVLAQPLARRVFDFPPPFLRRLYRAGVERTDAFLGRLVEQAAAAAGEGGLLVVVTSDHGESFGALPGVIGHHSSALDEQTRIPLIAWSPGRIPAGAALPPASLLDVAPSLLAFAGLASEPSFRGRSDLFGPAPPAADPAPRPLPIGFDLQADRPGDWSLVRAWIEGNRKSVRTASAGGGARTACFDLDGATLIDRAAPPAACAELSRAGERRLLAESGAALVLSVLAPGELGIDLALGRELAALDAFGPAAPPSLDAGGRPRWRVDPGAELLLLLADGGPLPSGALHLDGGALIADPAPSADATTLLRDRGGRPALRLVARAFRPEAASDAARRAEVVREFEARLRALGYLR